MVKKLVKAILVAGIFALHSSIIAFASDNFSGYTLNRYIFYGHNKDGNEYRASIVHDYVSSSQGKNEITVTVTGSFSYDCGYTLQKESGYNNDWKGPNGLNGNGKQSPYSVTITPQYAGTWTGSDYVSGSDSTYKFSYTVTVNHVWEDTGTKQDATCTNASKKLQKCKGCGVTQWVTTGNALSHNWQYTHDSVAHWQKCSRCGTTQNRANHTYNYITTKAATCTTDGLKTGTCTNTNCRNQITQTLTKLGHINPTNYTDGKDGYLYKYCTRCNAQLEKKAISYSVAFNSNNAASGSMPNQVFTYDTAQNLKTNTYTRTNYEFLGWSTDKEATSPTYTNQQSVKNLTTTNNGTVTLYAIWKLSTTAITFHDQGGSGGPGKVSWLIGSTQSPNTPKRQGYNFAGWTTNADGSGESWPANNVVPANNPDFYAQWVSNEYTNVQESNFN